MGFRSDKSQLTQTISQLFDGGLNLAQHATNIADNELTRAYNVAYSPSTGKLTTRGGLECVVALPDKAEVLHYYVKDASKSYLACVAGGKLYSMAKSVLEGATPAWTEIGTLTDGSVDKPAMLTFNGKLLIGGGQSIQSWDGTTFGVATSLIKASALAEFGGRVFANHTEEPDSVYACAAEDETDWDTSGSTAVGLRAGFGDQLSVNGFAVFGTDIIVSKGGHRSMLYRIATGGLAPESWTCQTLSDGNAAVNGYSIAALSNNIYFFDTNGFKGIAGVQEYGDFRVDPLARPRCKPPRSQLQPGHTSPARRGGTSPRHGRGLRSAGR